MLVLFELSPSLLAKISQDPDWFSLGKLTYNSSLRMVRMKAQWLERRSGSLPWSLTSIQLSLCGQGTDSYKGLNRFLSAF